jgi:hypothetical protein
VVNPVESIVQARGRLARLAALRTGLYASLPLTITVAAALSIDVVASLILDQWGYLLEPSRELMLLEGMFGLLAAQMAALVFFAWRAWRRTSDFVTTAERIDDLIGGHQEILTLATLADPERPELKASRSPLFPMLWRRAIAYLEPFEPKREFRLEFAGPLKRSSLLALATAAILGLAMIGSMRLATAAQLTSHRLRELARTLDTSSATPGARQLAAAARDVARDLESPRLPPEQKLAELQALKHELEKFQTQTQSAKGNSSGGSGSGQGGGNGNGSGQGTGKGSGGASKGAGQGAGSGGKGKKSDQQMVELRNDIAKAQIKLEEESKSGDKSQTAANNNEKGAGPAPHAGDNPKQAGPQNKPNGTGNINVPQPGQLAQNKMPSGNNPSGQKNDKGTQGDTHLGEFPKAVGYERFYKPGETGPPIDIRDARYVTFRLPSEVVSGAAGRTVVDNTRPAAATPYTNAPLKEQRVAISPDEQQLVPPRYRDLIH